LARKEWRKELGQSRAIQPICATHEKPESQQIKEVVRMVRIGIAGIGFMGMIPS
jgi:hypothetical protein